VGWWWRERFFAAGAVGVWALAVGIEVWEDFTAPGTFFDGNAGWMEWAAAAGAVRGAFAGGQARGKEGVAAGTVFTNWLRVEGRGLIGRNGKNGRNAGAGFF